MWRKILSVSLVLTLAGAGLNLAVGTVQARPHGGGHISGGFHSGSHLGGFHSGSHLGGFHSPGLLHGYRPGAHYDAHNHRYYPRYYRGYYGTWPYYGYYPANPYYSGLGDWYGADVGGSDEEHGQGYPHELDDDPTATTAPSKSRHDGRAEISMTLPANATLWAQGKKMPGSSSTREFHTPTLETGHRYSYDFRASWKENGQTVTQNQKVIITPRSHVMVHFPVPPAKTGTTPTH